MTWPHSARTSDTTRCGPTTNRPLQDSRPSAHFAFGATQLELGAGALPIDRHQPSQIAAENDQLSYDVVPASNTARFLIFSAVIVLAATTVIIATKGQLGQRQLHEPQP